jgi:hypothetical protein
MSSNRVINYTLKALLLLLIVLSLSKSEAAKKRPVLNPNLIKNVTYEISYNKGKKVVKETLQVACYQGTPGSVKKIKKGVQFNSFKNALRALRRKPKSSKTKITAARLTALIKVGASGCQNAPTGGGSDSGSGSGGGPGGGPISPTSPALSLAKYTGPFGEREARTLFERFSFGASPERIAESVVDGLDRTISKLTTYVDETPLDWITKDIECDTYLPGEKNREGKATLDIPNKCKKGNVNDFSTQGLRLSWYFRTININNRYFRKLELFLHDERLAATQGAANGNARWAVKSHFDLITRAARSGDYTQFMREWNSDVLGHLLALDGASNKGHRPNENYAREFWELGTTGPTDLDGKPVYDDLDLAQAVLAFSGWTMKGEEWTADDGTPYYREVAAYSPQLHAPGAFTIFRNSPYKAVVQSAEDVLQATFKHPRTAEHLAEDIWREFINPLANKKAIQELATIIREQNYNLHGVMRRVMSSQALYAQASHKTLIKHPIDLVMGFLLTYPQFKMTAGRTELYGIDETLDSLGQKILSPPSVFGWDEKKLAGEAFVLSWRNELNDILGKWELRKDYNFDLNNIWLKGINTSQDLIAKYARELNLTLTPAQTQHLDYFLNYNYRICYDWRASDERCKGGAPGFIERNVFDPHPSNENLGTKDRKVQGLLALMMQLPEYRMK